MMADGDFRMMLEASAPGATHLKAAYEAMAPLREYLAGAGIAPSTVVTGTVFTTDDIHAISRGMARVIEESDPPTASDIELCTAPGQKTACFDDGAGNTEDAGKLRVCVGHGRNVSDQPEFFHEVHMKITLPIFQQGAPPYLIDITGGDIELDGDGKAKVQRTEAVCAALTVPKDKTMPAGGWPVVLYGHGTGGWFNSFTFQGSTTSGVTGASFTSPGHDRATAVASLPDGDEGFAMLSFDQVQHGPRRGGSPVSPESLFFNFLNPKAARDNTLQGAGDVIALLKFLKNAGSLAVGGEVGNVSFNPDKVFYFGHSQGTVTGPPGLVFTDVPVVLMSGAGGNLVQSLLNKTQPVNIADGIRFAVADDGVDPFHEILNVLQHFIAPSDTINYGRNFFLEPPERGDGTGNYPPKHVMHIYGKRDFFAPEPNQQALAAAMGVTLLGPELTPVAGAVRQEDGELRNNIDLGGRSVTGGVVQYVPTQTEVDNDDGTKSTLDDYDGHFVSHHDSKSGGTVGGIDGWRTFLTTALRDGDNVPTITR